MIRRPASPPRLALFAALFAFLTGCAEFPSSGSEASGPGRSAASATAIGKILDVREKRFVYRDELLKRATPSRFVILGEVHDNAEHHRLQAEIFEAMLRAGRRPALAMEQFDREHQPALDSELARGNRDAERLADAGRFDRKGWRWPDYKPLVDLAATRGLRILAGNLSRADARTLMKSGRPAEGLGPADPAIQAALERDIVNGHCGVKPPAPMLAGMVEAQRARDAQLARALGDAGPGGAVLITGAGHARRDRGAPAYLPKTLADELVSIAFVEIDDAGQETETRDFSAFDFVWFTSRAEREDPCKAFRLS